MMKKAPRFDREKTAVSQWLRAVNPKHWIIFSIVLVFCVAIVLFTLKTSAINAFYDTSAWMGNYSNTALNDAYGIRLYSTAVRDYATAGLQPAGGEWAVPGGDMTGTSVEVDDPEMGSAVSAYSGFSGQSRPVWLVDDGHSLTFTYQGNVSGLFGIALDFFDLESNIANTQIAITVNGQAPFYESRTLVLPSEWRLESQTFTLDRYGNEIQPGSKKTQTWFSHELNDFNGMHPGLFMYALVPGDAITISYVNAALLIGAVRLVQETPIAAYADYLISHQGASEGTGQIVVAARHIASRNDPSIRLRSEQDPSNLYYDTQSLVLNVVFGDTWQTNGQSVTYELTVPETGFYRLSFKYRQYGMQDLSTFREIRIDGEVPFDLVSCYAFPYTSSFVNRTLVDPEGNPLLFFLEAGTHSLRMTAVNYPYRETIETLQYVMNRIQTLALNVKKYTSGGTDRYRDWEIETYFPTAAADISAWADLLSQRYDSLSGLFTDRQPAEIATLLTASERLKDIAANINKLPSLMVQFSDGNSSVNQMLGNLMQQMMYSSLELERIVLHGDEPLAKPYANLFVRLWEGLKRLVLSFIHNPYKPTAATEGELTVWVNHPRQYIEIMQSMIDQSYPGNIKVTLSQMPDQNKLILANASGQAPDVTIGVDNWIPYDFAIRQAALDLRQFAGYEELVSHFSKGAMIPYAFESGMYGFPETQNFWVTYYRKDILEGIGIDQIPQTWDEIIEILPLLQSYGMNYYLPLSMFTGLKPFVATLPFIYQFGGDLYAPDGMSTAINSEATLRGITLMSDLFTLYNIDKYVASFFNNFRYGTMPIGVSDLSTYLLLETTAVELDGLWEMDLHPGVYNAEKDEIIRYAACGAQASMIMSSTRYPQESWDFLSWWMSADVQSEFAFLLQSTYGQAYFWNTANLDAFATLSMPKHIKQTILAQWEYALEASRIPGSYMVEREISNAWTSIVYNAANPRQALDEAVRISNREILYKMAEFGYTSTSGQILKPYTVPSIYTIDDWLTEVNGDE
jgi:ABC-type glycerol-3-phosphate transport system substrate-binding protein